MMVKFTVEEAKIVAGALEACAGFLADRSREQVMADRIAALLRAHIAQGDSEADAAGGEVVVVRAPVAGEVLPPEQRASWARDKTEHDQ